MEVPQRLQQLLQQPDPLVIHHVIKWDGGAVSNGENGNKNSACYDVIFKSINLLINAMFLI